MTQELPFPHDLEAEVGVLGAVLHDIGNLHRLLGHLLPEHFFSLSHQAVWQAMVQMASAGEAVDEITLSNRLRANGKLELVGGMARVAEFGDLTPLSANVQAYAEIVLDKWRARRAITAMLESVGKIRERGAIGGAIHELGKTLREATGARITWESEDSAEILRRLLKRLEAPVEARQGLIYTGLPKIDEHVGGFSTSRPFVLAARPGVGKTILADQVARYNAAQGHPVLVWNLEMDEFVIAARRLAASARVPARPLVHCDADALSEQEWDRLSVAATELSGLPLYTMTTPIPPTLDVLESVTRQHMLDRGVRLVIVDHLGKIMVEGRNDFERQTERMLGISRICRSLRLPTLLVCHLNRDGEEEPTLKNLRGSGEIENNADVVMFLHDEDAMNSATHPVKAILAKSANGPKGHVRLEFDGPHARFRDSGASDQLSF